ncbi:ABC transporter permease [Saccharibacillus alkalitolerans]|uniref:ABC transporter permease n=1 Tax=Saccharibacillus alkalitolerans TaxID=2705290 RepID=A0ABX0FBJ9_9BACL|nr:ABC transporter permease [Saccharibacillus alkalitolerans]NGZ77334.1 ABC transporter permease [Saccharibacillus alkalitolerans]
MKTFGIVFGHSFKGRVRSKSFTWMTLLIVAAIAAIILIPRFFGGQALTEGTVAVVNKSPLPIEASELTSTVSPIYEWKMVPESELAAEQQLLQSEDLAAIVVIERSADAAAAPQIALSVNRKDDVSFAPNLSAYVERLNLNDRVESLGLTNEQAASLTIQPSLELNELNAGAKSFAETYLPIYTLLTLMFFMIYFFAGNVATSVAEEKGSRIQEILITKVSPVQLLAGKVVGVGLAGILQFAIIVGSGVLLMTFSGAGESLSLGGLSVDLSILGVQTLAVAAAMFILGYFFYATLFAAAGSIVSRSEEVNQAILPISMVFMVGFFLALIALKDPNGTLAVASSYIPLLTPMVLLVRVGAGEPALMEILLPILILAVSTLLVGLLSAKIYRGGVLLYGQKPSIGTMLKMLGVSNKPVRPQAVSSVQADKTGKPSDAA